MVPLATKMPFQEEMWNIALGHEAYLFGNVLTHTHAGH